MYITKFIYWVQTDSERERARTRETRISHVLRCLCVIYQEMKNEMRNISCILAYHLVRTLYVFFYCYLLFLNKRAYGQRDVIYKYVPGNLHRQIRSKRKDWKGRDNDTDRDVYITRIGCSTAILLKFCFAEKGPAQMVRG